jgi:hypothetical protein
MGPIRTWFLNKTTAWIMKPNKTNKTNLPCEAEMN